MKAEEISMMKAHTFSATPTPADAVTPMELTIARMIRNEMLTRRSCKAIGAPSPTILRSSGDSMRMLFLCISNGNSFLRITANDTITLMICAKTVAIAAPSVPSLNPAHKMRSPAMLKKQAIATVNSGVRESPRPRKIHPIRL